MATYKCFVKATIGIAIAGATGGIGFLAKQIFDGNSSITTTTTTNNSTSLLAANTTTNLTAAFPLPETCNIRDIPMFSEPTITIEVAPEAVPNIEEPAPKIPLLADQEPAPAPKKPLLSAEEMDKILKTLKTCWDWVKGVAPELGVGSAVFAFLVERLVGHILKRLFRGNGAPAPDPERLEMMKKEKEEMEKRLAELEKHLGLRKAVDGMGNEGQGEGEEQGSKESAKPVVRLPLTGPLLPSTAPPEIVKSKHKRGGARNRIQGAAKARRVANADWNEDQLLFDELYPRAADITVKLL